MRWKTCLLSVLTFSSVLALAGCRRPPAAPPHAPPQTEVPPAPPGMAVSGFWSTWGRPLAACLKEHRARRGRRCRSALAITVKKEIRRMVVTCEGEPVKGYFVALGSAPEGPKERRGDGRTPEGTYYVWGKNRQSRYYLSLGVSYPNPRDAARGLEAGLVGPETHRRVADLHARWRKPPQNTRLGGDIFIHGGGIGDVVREGARRYVRVRDWTAGCMALRNCDMDELLDLLPAGIPVRILP